MNILVTGAKGFIGKNLCESLKCVRDGKDRTRPWLHIEDIYEYDIDSSSEELSDYCRKADFVFHLAGVNRPKDEKEFRTGNVGLSGDVLSELSKQGSTATVVLSSSVQATLSGRFGVSEYGISKRDAEELVFSYGEKTGVPVYVYRFPNVAGKWARPNYNSAIVTFCYNISRGLPVTVNNRETVLDILFVEDLVAEFIDNALKGTPSRCDFEGTDPVFKETGRYCGCPVTYKASLGSIVDTLYAFNDFGNTLVIPEMKEGSFEKKLISTFISYFPGEKVSVCPKTSSDSRGAFTELIKKPGFGQISVNVTRPFETKGQHWHHAKWEIFTVVSGRALIRERQIGSDTVIEKEVSGDTPENVFMLPGYTHSIKNISEKDDLVTIMYANEVFDSERPDTFRENV